MFRYLAALLLCVAATARADDSVPPPPGHNPATTTPVSRPELEQLIDAAVRRVMATTPGLTTPSPQAALASAQAATAPVAMFAMATSPVTTTVSSQTAIVVGPGPFRRSVGRVGQALVNFGARTHVQKVNLPSTQSVGAQLFAVPTTQTAVNPLFTSAALATPQLAIPATPRK